MIGVVRPAALSLLHARPHLRLLLPLLLMVVQGCGCAMCYYAWGGQTGCSEPASTWDSLLLTAAAAAAAYHW
jgi:hypothetical protein